VFNVSGIEWCTHTWNPVTGCLHGCDYCYARKIARRFAGCYDPKADENIKQHEAGILHMKHTGHVFYKTKRGKVVRAPFPYGFTPTFHTYRLDDPAQHKKPAIVFVGSMCDLFGEWVPDEWIEEVFEACAAAPWHTYLFLTKNPERYNRFRRAGMLPEKHWYGTTVTKYIDRFFRGDPNLPSTVRKTFASIEPLLGPVISDHPIRAALNPVDWIIIGAETGNRKGKVVPERAWVEDICTAADAAGAPVFMKESLLPIMGAGGMRREFPAELRR